MAAERIMLNTVSSADCRELVRESHHWGVERGTGRQGCFSEGNVASVRLGLL